MNAGLRACFVDDVLALAFFVTELFLIEVTVNDVCLLLLCFGSSFKSSASTSLLIYVGLLVGWKLGTKLSYTPFKSFYMFLI